MTSVSRLPPVPSADLEHVLEKARTDLDALRGERVFVTGGTGFVGTWLMETIAFANDRLGADIAMFALSRDPQRFAARSPHLASRDDIVLHEGDVRTFEFPPGHFPFVIHAATDSRSSVQSADRWKLATTIVDGTSRLLRLAQDVAAESVLFVSSGAVYGPQPADMQRIPESYAGGPDPVSSTATYGEAKRMAEHLCTLANSERMVVRVARLFAFVGPLLPLDAHFAVGNFLRDAATGRTIEVHGDGTPRRSYLHAADLVVWLLRILISGQPLRPYNVGSDRAVSIGDLAVTVARLAGRPGAVRVAQSPDNNRSPAHYVPDIERARTELGLNVWLDLEESLTRTLDWVRSFH